MNQTKLEKILKKFNNIKPNKDWSNRSRFEILDSPVYVQEEYELATEQFSLKRSFWTSVNFASLLGTVAIIVVGVYFATKELSPFFLPGLNQRNIVAEADMINQSIQVRVAQIEYFKETSDQATVALTHVSTNSLNHLNETVISSEADKIDMSLPSNDSTNDVNNQLNNILKNISE